MIRRCIAVIWLSVVMVAAAASGALACDFSAWLFGDGAPRPGALLPIRGGGFDAGPVTLVWDRTNGEVIGHADVGADGHLQASVRVPPDAGAGVHKVVAVAKDTHSSPVHPAAWVDVVIPVAGANQPTTVGVEQSLDAPPTRSDGIVVALLAATLLGAIAWRGSRRRKRAGDADGLALDLDSELRRLLDAHAAQERCCEPLAGRTRSGSSPG